MGKINKKECSKKDNCPCLELDCPRRGNCEECQKYHRLMWIKTSCGK